MIGILRMIKALPIREQHIKKVERDANVWERARRIRGFLDAYEAAAHAKGEVEVVTRDWIARARGHADQIGPLT